MTLSTGWNAIRRPPARSRVVRAVAEMSWPWSRRGANRRRFAAGGTVNDWTITLPGLPAMVPVARKHCRAFFDGTPRLEALELIAAELSANALRHTASGERGGWFAVRTLRRDGWARIEVADQGSGRWVRLLAPPDEDEETGRGLSIVTALADRVGHDTTREGQRVWAEVIWPEPAPIQ